jgi:hypothetical protein
MGRVAAWQRALSGADFAEADGPLGLVHAQHARGRAAVGDADSRWSAARTTARWYAPLPKPTFGGAQQPGEGRGAPPMRVASALVCLCAAGDADREVQALLSQNEARPTLA